MFGSVKLVGFCAYAVLLLGSVLPANAEIIQTSSGQCFLVTRDANGTIISSQPSACEPTRRAGRIASLAGFHGGLENGQLILFSTTNQVLQGARSVEVFGDPFPGPPPGVPADLPPPPPPLPTPFSSGPIGGPGEPSHLGMYLPTATTNGVTLFGGGWSERRSGVGISDTAGAFAAGTLAPTSSDKTLTAGISGSYDAAHLVGANQTLRFAGSFRYERNAVEYGSSPTLAAIGVANAGTLHKDAYHFDGAALYRFGSNYLLAGGGFYFGKGSELQAIDGSTGSFATHGYSAYLQLGHVFALLGAAEDVSLKRAITKAPPAAASRFSVGLDVSAGVGYGEETIDGFTDSTGFIWGDERRKAGEVGGQATLFA